MKYWRAKTTDSNREIADDDSDGQGCDKEGARARDILHKTGVIH